MLVLAVVREDEKLLRGDCSHEVLDLHGKNGGAVILLSALPLFSLL